MGLLKRIRKGLGLPPITIKTVLGAGSDAKVGQTIGAGVDKVLGQVADGVPVGTAVQTTVSGAAGVVAQEAQQAAQAARLYLSLRGAVLGFLNSPLPWVILAFIVARRFGRK